MKISRKNNLKLNRQMPFQVHENHILQKDYIKRWTEARPAEATCTYRSALYQKDKELESFLDILNFLNKYSPVTLEVCEPMRKHTLVKTEWMWNQICDKLYKKPKAIIKTKTQGSKMKKNHYILRQMCLMWAWEQGKNKLPT